MKRFFLLMGSAAGALCLAASATHAASTPTSTPSWSYSFNVDPASQQIGTTGNNGFLTMTGASGVAASGNSVVTLASLQLNSTSQATDSAVLSSDAWKGVLSIHDPGSTAPGTLTLSGAFTGPMGANGQTTPATFSANNANVYFNPAALSITPNGSGWSTVMATNSVTGQSQIADYVWKASSGNTYTIPVADLSFTPPGIPYTPPPGSTTTSPQLNGAIAATIEVNATTGTGTKSGGGGTGTPEPSTLLLSCFGLGFAGLASWRRRRNLAAQLA